MGPAIEDLQRVLREGWGVRATAIEAHRTGYEGQGYRVSTSGSPLFLRVNDAEMREQLPFVLRVTSELAGLRVEEVPGALPTKSGDLSMAIGSYPITLYPFLEGATLDEQDASSTIWRRFGAAVGKVHRCSASLVDCSGPLDDFSTDRIPDVHVVTQAALRLGKNANDVDLISERVGLRVQQMLDLKELISKTRSRYVVTHGDLTPDNVIVGEGGLLAITDWNRARWAPAERDIAYFANPHFQHLVAGYAQERASSDLDQPLLEFFILRRYIDSVTFLAGRIVSRSGSASDLRLLQWHIDDLMADPAETVRAILNAFGEARTPS